MNLLQAVEANNLATVNSILRGKTEVVTEDILLVALNTKDLRVPICTALIKASSFIEGTSSCLLAAIKQGNFLLITNLIKAKSVATPECL